MLDSISQQFPAVAPATLETRPYSKRQQLLQGLLGDSELLLKNRLEVRHLMTRQPVVIPPTATLEEMTSLMKQRRLHHLLVCGRGGELLGVVSDRDLHPSHGATAQQMMSFPALSCSPDTPVGAAITYLINENISCLPVVDNGRLVGVLTTTDLVLTLQCTLQLWLRLAQVLQHDPTWSRELEKIAATLDGAVQRRGTGRPDHRRPPGDPPGNSRPGQRGRPPLRCADGHEQPARVGRNPELAVGRQEASRAAVLARRGGDRLLRADPRELRRRGGQAAA